MLELPFVPAPPMWPVAATLRPATMLTSTQGELLPGSALYPPLLTAPPVPTIPTILTAVAIRRGQPSGPATDQEIEDFVYEVLELLPGTSDVEIRCESGRATLTGAVQHKRLKHDIGEIVWTIPSINDVQNTIAITTKRRARTQGREADTQPMQAVAARKQT